MKPILPAGLLGAAMLFLGAPSSVAEEAPAGALEKIDAALPAEPFAAPKKQRTMLIFSKTKGYRHASIPTGKLAFEELGKKTGAFSVVISDDLKNFEKDALKQFDAICFLSTTQDVFTASKDELDKMSDEEKAKAADTEKRLKENLMEFVKSGKGFVGIHAATDTCYEWEEYGKMMNGFFDGHPWGAGTHVSIKVEPGKENHPMTKMFAGENLEFNEEIYQFKDPYDSGNVEMFLRIDTKKTDMTLPGIKRTDGDFGVSWAHHWGDGRVFYCSLGHNDEMYWNPKILKHYLAGIQWALGDFDAGITK
ncbi:ThuA domain-containing protein [Luteolibacter pohnpeiensis]|uniref:ThuA domain-containing protein n=1 Tax=Luteolibacter pohnpeiensis TaxID=454153 RepID=A0A934S3E3_9BACT|nr:ThuA domain-containing protein [Luteolibacter pohnpeiensis]MBK1882445.1 ThuA domain-containing protein [Luteolibacter pohnpeiensis]